LLRFGRFELSYCLGSPLIMGIINVTPDSFSDGGTHSSTDQAIAHAHLLISQGADILDIGAESTRPNAEPVSEPLELARITPVLEALRDRNFPVSVDTRKPAVMRLALSLGADMINDVSGFTDPQSIAAVSASDCACCVMHMQADPLTMQRSPEYRDVVAQVRDFFYHRVNALQLGGVGSNRILLDPGIGFGKTLDHNLQLLKQLNGLSIEGLPLLVGLSRKSMIGELTGKSVDQRMAGSVGAALAAAQRGAAVLRVHDVAQTKDALTVFSAIV
jgi:dihydropteroate synthase